MKFGGRRGMVVRRLMKVESQEVKINAANYWQIKQDPSLFLFFF